MGKSADPFYTVATELSRTRGNALFICLFVAMCFLCLHILDFCGWFNTLKFGISDKL